MGNLTSRESDPLLQGDIAGFPPRASLTLNARVEMPPEDLERLAHDALSKVAGDRVRVETLTLHCFSPGRPQPTYRYDSIAD